MFQWVGLTYSCLADTNNFKTILKKYLRLEIKKYNFVQLY